MIKQYRSLDLFKFICAILIIILHTNPLSSYSKIATIGTRHVLTTVAVPCFFIISGFLFFEKINSLATDKEKNGYFKKYIKRLIGIYLFWSAVYFIFVLIKWSRIGFSKKLVIEYIRDFFFEGSYSTIWFLVALISAVTITFLLRKKLDSIKIFIISLFVYTFTLLGTAYYGISVKIPFLKTVFDAYYSFFDTMKNGLLFGFVFISIGALISENKGKMKAPTKKIIYLIAVFWGLLALEQGFRMFLGGSKSSDTVIMLIPLCFLLCWGCINLELKESPVYTVLRKYSMCMFLTQRIPLSIISFWFEDSISAQNSLLYFSVTTLSTLAISFVLINLSKKIKFLKTIY